MQRRVICKICSLVGLIKEDRIQEIKRKGKFKVGSAKCLVQTSNTILGKGEKHEEV